MSGSNNKTHWWSYPGTKDPETGIVWQQSQRYEKLQRTRIKGRGLVYRVNGVEFDEQDQEQARTALHGIPAANPTQAEA